MKLLLRMLSVSAALEFGLLAFQAPQTGPARPESREEAARTARQLGELSGPTVLMGKVKLSDELVPDELIAVELVCRGTVRASIAADSKGRFHLVVPSQGAKEQSASLGRSGSLSAQYLDGCQLRAVLTGYRSDVIDLSKHRTADNPDVGTIVLHRPANVAGAAISATSAAAPKDARKALEKGRLAFGASKYDVAREELEKAVRIYPQYAAAWFELGLLCENRGALADARHAYNQAISVDPKFVSPYERLMILMGSQNKPEEVVRLSDRLIELDPQGFPIAYLSNAIANYNLGNSDASEKSAAALIKLDTEHRFPKGERVLGIVLAEKQEWEESAAHLRRFLELEPTGTDAEATKVLLAQVEQKAQAARKQK